MTISQSACLSVISCNIRLSYWSPAPSTTTLPISEPHSKIVRMNKLLDKEQAAAVDMTWHDMTWHDISALLNWTWISFFAGSFIITRDTDTNPWIAGLDGSDKKLPIVMVLAWTTVFYQILITYSTAQQQLLIWNRSSQSLVMQNVKNVRRRIDKRRKVNLSSCATTELKCAWKTAWKQLDLELTDPHNNKLRSRKEQQRDFWSQKHKRKTVVDASEFDLPR